MYGVIAIRISLTSAQELRIGDLHVIPGRLQASRTRISHQSASKHARSAIFLAGRVYLNYEALLE